MQVPGEEHLHTKKLPYGNGGGSKKKFIYRGREEKGELVVTFFKWVTRTGKVNVERESVCICVCVCDLKEKW